MYTYHNSEERYEKDEYFAKRKNGFFFGELLQRGGFLFKLHQIEQHAVHGGRKLVPKRTKRDKSDRGRRLYYNNMYSCSPYRR